VKVRDLMTPLRGAQEALSGGEGSAREEPVSPVVVRCPHLVSNRSFSQAGVRRAPRRRSVSTTNAASVLLEHAPVDHHERDREVDHQARHVGERGGERGEEGRDRKPSRRRMNGA
jgi:hypothetical protein